MKKQLIVVLCVLCSIQKIIAGNAIFDQYLQNNFEDKTLSKFPYEQYVKNLDFKIFKDDLMYLKKKNISDQIFIRNTLTLYIKSVENKKSIDFLIEHYKISEDFYKIYKSDSIHFISFGTVQNVILGHISFKLQNEIDKNNIDPNDENVEKLIHNLSSQHYLIHVKPPLWKKVWHYLKQGQLNYVMRKAFSSYLKETLLIILIFLILISIVFFIYIFLKKRKKMKSVKKHLLISLISVLSIFLCSNISIDELEPTLKQTKQAKQALSLEESLQTSFYNDEVNVYQLTQNSSLYGYAVWFSRQSQKTKVKYFAKKNAYSNYLTWKKTKRILLVCSGAYSTSFNINIALPVGLTVDDGEKINATLQNDMDGLAIVYATGGIAVSNIKENNLYVGSLNTTLNLNNDIDRNTFIEWSTKERATVFQTHLLGWKNFLNISSTNSAARVDKRRLLALIKDRMGVVQYVVFNTATQVRLWDAANETLNYLKDKNVEIIAILNLEAGGLDCSSTFNEAGQEISYLRGGTNDNFSKTTNLIVFYRD